MCPPTQWLVEPKPKKRTEDRAATSPVVPAPTVAGSAHADPANKVQCSALTSRPGHLSGWLSPRTPSEQKINQGPQLSCPPPQCLAKPTPTERTEARAAPSPDVQATIVAA